MDIINVARQNTSHEFDLLCLSHLRWDFVYQRPQHLMTRFAQRGRVFFIEEPIFGNTEVPRLDISPRPGNIMVCVPQLPHGLSIEEAEAAQEKLLAELVREMDGSRLLLWYYTPMALGFTQDIDAALVIYDCMDELSAFRFAPPLLKEREQELMLRADLVFTGGQSLYEAKKDSHPDIYPFPSSIDREHFAKARDTAIEAPADQEHIPSPRLGFFGVIDERMDIVLLDRLAELRPDWSFIMIGPVVKIPQEALPRRSNIYYLGAKSYEELPAYIAGWDLAIMPFAHNESTRFISPTKTPEYLAAGTPVVSTSIRDVVRPYGALGLVEIADLPESFVNAAETAMENASAEWLERVDSFLDGNSWDTTWSRMYELICTALMRKTIPAETGDGAITIEA